MLSSDKSCYISSCDEIQVKNVKYIFKAKRVVFFSSCTEFTGSICLFCNAQSFFFIYAYM